MHSIPPAAMWLASLAPPRSEPAIGRPSRPPALARTSAVGGARVHPWPGTHHRRLEPDVVVLGRQDAKHRRERLELVGAQVAEQLARGRHDVEGVARAQDRRHGGQPVGPGRVAAPCDQLGPCGEREQGAAAELGRGAGVRGRPCAFTSSVAAAFRFTITPSEPSGLRSPPSKQGSVEAGEARRVGERRGPPLLVVHEQHGDLGVQLGRSASSRMSASESATPPFMSTRPTPRGDRRRAQRPVRDVMDDRVKVAEQHDPLVTATAQARRSGPRRGRRSSTHPLHLRLGGQERGCERHALLGAPRSPDGDDTATSASSSRSVIRAAPRSGSW